MSNDFSIDLSLVPTNILKGAVETLTNDMYSTKTKAVETLSAAIRMGKITLHEVQSAMPSQPVTGTRVINVTPDHHTTAASGVADRALQTALDASTAVNRLTERANDAASHVSLITKILESDIRSVRDQVGRITDMIPSDLIADAVASKVAAAFAPFEAAVKAASAEAVVGSMVSVSKIGTLPASQVFGIRVDDAMGREMMVDIYNDASAPAIDPHWVWTEPILKHLLLSQTTGENLWFGGDKGTGKSESVKNFASKTGRGFCRINFQKYTTNEDYIGALGLENGSSVFKEGDFLRAFSTPATLILLDEPTNADPAVLASLNGFLEKNSTVSYGGAVRKRAPNVLVFAADNTLTNGDETGRYAGTRAMNSALADRFARLVLFKHMDIETEIKAVVLHTGCKPELAEHVLKAVNACRAKVASGDIVDAPSIRQVMAFIRSVGVLGVDEAWAASIGHRQPSESATAIAGIKAAYINTAIIMALIGETK